MDIQLGLSFFPDSGFLKAAYPLFHADEVDILEWSFDTDWAPETKPDWAKDVLEEYSTSARLLGHGVSYSFLSANREKHHSTWLNHLNEELKRREYVHITEHFGFCSGGDFHRSAPLPVPVTDEALSLGRTNLARLSETAKVPIGIENLAFAFSSVDVENQGRFIEELLRPINGFLLCDLHNLFCQVKNFNLSAEELLQSYPLDLVREVHISGGSWSDTEVGEEVRTIRRDTHDHRVPEEVFEILSLAIKQCPNLKYVVLEQLPEHLQEEEQQLEFQEDFRRARQILEE